MKINPYTIPILEREYGIDRALIAAAHWHELANVKALNSLKEYHVGASSCSLCAAYWPDCQRCELALQYPEQRCTLDESQFSKAKEAMEVGDYELFIACAEEMRALLVDVYARGQRIYGDALRAAKRRMRKVIRLAGIIMDEAPGQPDMEAMKRAIEKIAQLPSEGGNKCAIYLNPDAFLIMPEKIIYNRRDKGTHITLSPETLHQRLFMADVWESKVAAAIVLMHVGLGHIVMRMASEADASSATTARTVSNILWGWSWL